MKPIIDPIGIYKTIKENNLRYYRTTFNITKPESLAISRDKELEKDGDYSRFPWIELMPKYKSSGIKSHEISNAKELNLNSEQLTLLNAFNKKWLGEKFELYEHQIEMLKAAIADSKHTVITSGTGSGKTESFLLPLFAQIFKEAKTWNAPSDSNSPKFWQKINGYTNKMITNKVTGSLKQELLRRNHENRPAAVRAMIIYPMNALVEDQLGRLRKALCSDYAEEFYKQHLNGNKIWLGRYNGSTPGSGFLAKEDTDGSIKLNDPKIKALKDELKKIEHRNEAISIRIAELQNKAKISIEEKLELEELVNNGQYLFPRNDRAELITRYDMQETPPDILVTNFSMLNIMLSRKCEASIFEKTKEWLKLSEDNFFHLIVDELHLNRGTAGNEVAYIIRMMLDKLGLALDSHQYRILASSASLDKKDPKTKNFIENFFGVPFDKFEIIEGNNQWSEYTDNEGFLQGSPLANLTSTYQDLAIQVETSTDLDDVLRQLLPHIKELTSLKELTEPKEIIDSVYQYFHTNLSKIVSCFKVDGILRAVSSNPKEKKELYNLSKKLFGGDFDKGEDAIQGLLILRGLLDWAKEAGLIDSLDSLPRFRLHLFYKNIGGVYASIKPKPEDEDYRWEPNEVFLEPVVADSKGNRVFDILKCENCNEVFFGGYNLEIIEPNNYGEETTKMSLIQAPKELHNFPEITIPPRVYQRSHKEYKIFWPCHNPRNNKYIAFGENDENPIFRNVNGRYVTENKQPYSGQKRTNNGWSNPIIANQIWQFTNLDIKTGEYTSVFAKSETDAGQIKGLMLNIEHIAEQNLKEFYALPSVCPSCGLDHHNKKNAALRSPIRELRTGFAQMSQFFASELFYALPDQNKKLVAFSDSREQAAKLSSSIEKFHYNGLLRTILYTVAEKQRINYDDLSKALTRYNKIGDLPRFTPKEIIEICPEFDKETRDLSPEKSIIDFVSELEQKRSWIHFHNLVKFNSEDNEPGKLDQELLKLGINPFGPDIDGQKLGNLNFPNWIESNIDNIKIKNDGNDEVFIDSYKQKIKDNLRISIAQATMSGRYQSYESMGLGIIGIPEHDTRLSNITQKLKALRDSAIQVGFSTISNPIINDHLSWEIVNGWIRVMAENYRFSHFENLNTNPSTIARNYVLKCIGINVRTGTLQRLNDYLLNLYSAISGNENEIIPNTNGVFNYVLQFQNLSIKVSNAEDEYIQCKTCDKVHLHKAGGVCTSCFATEFTEPKIVKVLWEKHFMAFSVKNAGRKPHRFHCEELTGQTDDPLDRQLSFRGIIPSETDIYRRKAKEIDLLSVTTTLEVGVDIGNLQAMVMANMPPTRFNYQQRVGRAGRRNSAFAFAVTFCRGGSHDNYYFANTERITGDSCPVPVLTENNIDILKRIVTKKVLIDFAYESNRSRSFYPATDLYVQLGEINLSEQELVQLKVLIVRNRDNYESFIVDKLKAADKKEELLDFLLNSLSTLVEASQEKDNAPFLSERLASQGLLPMLGMPTSVRSLYHGGLNNSEKIYSIERPLDLAITEFAFGKTKTKDKALHTCIALTPAVPTDDSSAVTKETEKGKYYTWKGKIYNCKQCGQREQSMDSEKDIPRCSTCGANFNIEEDIDTLVIPSAFRTDMSKGSADEEENYEASKSIPVFVTGVDKDKIQTKRGIQLVDKASVWKVNNNNGNLFEGVLVNLVPTEGKNNESKVVINGDDSGNTYDLNNKYHRTFKNASNQWLESSAFRFDNRPPNFEKLALGSRKFTEVLIVGPEKVYENLLLDHLIFGQLNINQARVKSAFYSAAFILQRILSDYLDVDPNEIEIAELRRSKQPDDTFTSQFVLLDALPNGSGFVRTLYNDWNAIVSNPLLELGKASSSNGFLNSLVEEDHINTCNGSCQKCLNGYYNSNYHPILDWRAGLALLRLIDGQSPTINDPEWKDYLEKSASILRDYAHSIHPDDNSISVELIKEADSNWPYLVLTTSEKTSHFYPWIVSTENTDKSIFQLWRDPIGAIIG